MVTPSKKLSDQQQLGQLLRNHRISREWSLEDVSSQTRLDTLVLRHLEEGNLEAPPGKVFMRGFLRIYLQFLQIAPSEIELFHEVIEHRPKTRDQITSMGLEHLSGKSSGIDFRRWVVGLALTAALLLIWQMNSRDVSVNGEDPIESSVEGKIRSLSENQIKQNDGSGPQSITKVHREEIFEFTVGQDSSGEQLTAEDDSFTQDESINSKINQEAETHEIKAALKTEQLENNLSDTEQQAVIPILELRALESVWIAVQADTERATLHYLQAGEILSWETATEAYTLTIGDTKAIQVRLNEQQHPLPDNNELLLDWRIDLNEIVED
jgi:cytoskeletal protein RodZ